jgi:hypothetical protein
VKHVGRLGKPVRRISEETERLGVSASRLGKQAKETDDVPAALGARKMARGRAPGLPGLQAAKLSRTPRRLGAWAGRTGLLSARPGP